MAALNPLKSVVNSLSPRSPFLLSPSSKIKETAKRKSNVVKSLNFGKTLKVPPNVASVLPENISKFEEKPSKKDFLINTPNKNDLTRNGLRSTRNVDVLGRGGFGVVFKGNYQGRTVAVKLIKSKTKAGGHPPETNAITFQHPNVIATIDVTRNLDDGFAVVLMEYALGARALQIVIDDDARALDAQTIARYVADICAGLQYCHQRGILHLDVKPKNVLVCGNACKICDFGNSVNLESFNGEYKFQGTVAYAAPELFRDEKPTEKCDVYSLGITCWQMIYRKTPFENICDQTVIYSVVKRGARPAYEKNDDVLTNIFTKMWHQEAKMRPDVEDVLNILRNFK